MKENIRHLQKRRKEHKYLEIVVDTRRLLIIERSGGGQIEKLIKTLGKYGLSFKENYNSPCG